MLRSLPGVFLVDNHHAHRRPLDNGRPSYVGLTFLALDDSYGWIGDNSIFSSLSATIHVFRLSLYYKMEVSLYGQGC